MIRRQRSSNVLPVLSLIAHRIAQCREHKQRDFFRKRNQVRLHLKMQWPQLVCDPAAVVPETVCTCCVTDSFILISSEPILIQRRFQIAQVELTISPAVASFCARPRQLQDDLGGKLVRGDQAGTPRLQLEYRLRIPGGSCSRRSRRLWRRSLELLLRFRLAQRGFGTPAFAALVAFRRRPLRSLRADQLRRAAASASRIWRPWSQKLTPALRTG